MERFKPKIDKLFWIIFVPTFVLLAITTTIVCIYPEPAAIIITVAVDLVLIYFFVSPLFGYAELRRESLYIKYGFFMSRDIPYDKIREFKKEHKLYSESMMSLKNAIEHVNIKYNKFDVTTISVVNNDTFIRRLRERIFAYKSTYRV